VAGLCLGPQGLNLLRSSMLELLDPAVPVALVALGLLVPFLRTPRAVALELAPVLIAGVIVLGVTADQMPLDAFVRHAGRVLQVCGAASLIAVAGSLLLGRITSATERRVVVLALLLLAGGLADFSAAPGLLIGATVAVIWRSTSRASTASSLSDVDYLVGPLAAAMLLIAGARLDVSALVVLVAVVLAVIMITISRTGHGDFGVVAVAGAVDLARGVSPDAAPVVSAAAIAVVIVQLVVAGFTSRHQQPVAVAGTAA
jgi:hypothetical protein